MATKYSVAIESVRSTRNRRLPERFHDTVVTAETTENWDIPIKEHNVQVYYSTLDTALEEMNSRFGDVNLSLLRVLQPLEYAGMHYQAGITRLQTTVLHNTTTNHNLLMIFIYYYHRALADVEAMERILVKTGLVDFLSTLPVISPAQKFGAWATQKRTHTIESSLASQTPIQICVGVWLARLPQILSSLGKRSSYQRSS